MITHVSPAKAVLNAALPGARERSRLAGSGGRRTVLGLNCGRHGPFVSPLYLASRRKGRVSDPGALPPAVLAAATASMGPLLLPTLRSLWALCARMLAGTACSLKEIESG